MADTTHDLESLARRVQSLEDERAIHRTLVRYGFAVDSNDADALVDLYTDDTVIEVDGDHAVAVGYACVVVRDGDGLSIWREGCNRWELERRGAAWQIRRRQSFAVGTPGAQAILSSGL